MLSARKTFYLVTFRNSSEQQNDNSLFPSNFKAGGGGESLLSTSQLPPIIQNCHQVFSELLQMLERRIRYMRGEAESLF